MRLGRWIQLLPALVVAVVGGYAVRTCGHVPSRARCLACLCRCDVLIHRAMAGGRNLYCWCCFALGLCRFLLHGPDRCLASGVGPRGQRGRRSPMGWVTPQKRRPQIPRFHTDRWPWCGGFSRPTCLSSARRSESWWCSHGNELVSHAGAICCLAFMGVPDAGWRQRLLAELVASSGPPRDRNSTRHLARRSWAVAAALKPYAFAWILPAIGYAGLTGAAVIVVISASPLESAVPVVGRSACISRDNQACRDGTSTSRRLKPACNSLVGGTTRHFSVFSLAGGGHGHPRKCRVRGFPILRPLGEQRPIGSLSFQSLERRLEKAIS